MPYPNEHAARVRDPKLFVKDSFRRKEIAPGVSIIIGKLKSDPDGPMVVQAYRFDKNKFTPEEAREWLKKHNIKARLEAAKMSDRYIYITEITLDESGDDDKPVISTEQILRKGTFEHPMYGKLQFDDELFDKLIGNFNKNVRKVDIAVDVEHRPEEGAAGWFRKLFKKDDGLYAEIEWTEKGVELIKGKIYKYMSADYTPNYIDPETGKQYGPTLLGAALTNRPFVKGMKPVNLSDFEGGDVTLSTTPYADLPIWEDLNRAFPEEEVSRRIRKWASSDGSGDKDKIDWEKYRRAFFWYDASNPENFGSYKLKFADVINGRLYAIWRGVRGSMAVLNGARRGVDIPDEDREAVYRHIVRYYKKFGKEPPELRKLSEKEVKLMDKILAT